jgi:predicted tellurium resistance membrane protein TerC
MNFYADLQGLLSIHGLISLFTLSLLELVLGVDNIIFISLVLAKIPEENRFNVRVIALSIAFLMRIIMLYGLVWLSHITTTLFSISNFQVSIRDILFFMGGAYLTVNTVKEIITHLNTKKSINTVRQIAYKSVILHIVVVDMLFSFDSIFTAIGLIPNLIIMVLAVGIGMIFMIYLSGQTTKFIEKYPPVKTLALLFIIAVGLMLVTQALHLEIHRKYFYLVLMIALLVEGAKSLMKKIHN